MEVGFHSGRILVNQIAVLTEHLFNHQDQRKSMQKTALYGRISHAIPCRSLSDPTGRSTGGSRYATKILLVMRLTTFFLMIGLMSVCAKSVSQQVTYSAEKVKLTEVFKEIKKQTGFFVISEKTLLKNARPVTVRAVNEPLQSFMTKVLAGQSLSFTIEQNTIVISAVPPSFLNPLPGNGQQADPVTGIIKGPDGQPLQNASVVIKGTTTGVMTDEKGRYSIKAVPGQVLVISFLGMQSQEVKVGASSIININLTQTTTKLDDIVVTGYSNVRKESFTGNAIRITQDQILKVGNRNVLSVLQVFDPSFRLEKNNLMGSDPNTVPQFYIRGRSGIGLKELDAQSVSAAALVNNPNLPIFIMDGYEVAAEKVYDYDPNRIKSITILKDAAATAVYGSRAANGVIVIETVPPAPGKMSVNYNVVTSLTVPDLSDYNLMNASEKLEAERLSGVYDVVTPGSTSAMLVDEYIRKLSNVQRGVNTDWIAQPLQNEFSQKHTLYVDGGSEQVRYGFLAKYDKQNGVMKGSSRERSGVGFTLDYRGKRIQVRNDVTYDIVNSVNSPYGNFADYTTKSPYDPMYDGNGQVLKNTTSWHGGQTINLNLVNPLYEVLKTKNFNKSGYQAIADNLSLNWQIMPHWQLRGQVAVTKTINESKNFIDPASGRYNPTDNTTRFEDIGSLTLVNSDILTVNTNLFTNYTNNIGEHNINISLGVNTNEATQEGNSATYTGFPSGSQSSPNFAAKVASKPVFADSHTRLFGSFLQANYSYKDIYLLDISGRLDGSSQFGTDRKYAPFWSVGAGLNLHKYDFLKDNPVISRARVTANMGQLGKTNFPPYAAQDIYTRSPNWYRTGTGVSLTYMGNPALNWEKTNSRDLIFDMGFLQDRFTINVDLYNKVTNDLVNDVDLPLSAGFDTYKDNIGRIRNNGFEVNIRAEIVRRKDVLVAVYGNFAHNRNVLLDVSQSLKKYNDLVDAQYNGYTSASATSPVNAAKYGTSRVKYIEGQSVTAMYGMQSLGINPMNGKEVYLKKDGTVTYVWSAADQVVIGDPTPTGQGAFGINISYKDFTLFTSALYEYGGQQYNYTLLQKVENVDIYNRNADRRVLTQRWVNPGDVTMLKDIKKGLETTLPTSRFMQDYNAITINSLSLGYTVKREFLRQLHMSMVRAQFTTNNLAVISSVQQERGLAYPFARTFDFSLNVSF